MRVFVAGASGVIGRRLVPLLTGAGHHVTGLTRSAERAPVVRALGAEPVVCDVFDAARLREVVKAAQPEVVVHELTRLPQRFSPRKLGAQLAPNDRVRREGTGNLMSAAVEAGASRVVAQSIAFAYVPHGSPVKREEDPLYLNAPEPLGRSARATQALEEAVTATPGIEGVVLRYGFFYGPGSAYAADGAFGVDVRRRRLPLVGGGTGVFSFIHVDDAASATVAALDQGEPGIYNVVDDDPAPVSEWLPYYAAVLGARPPRRVPVWLARLIAGDFIVIQMTELRGASNDRAKQALGWQPRWPSWRAGFRESLG